MIPEIILTAIIIQGTPPPKLVNNDAFVISCALEAANLYQLPAAILLAVISKEGGRPGMKVRNKNGTYDIGFMQFNTAYLKALRHYNITENDVNQKNCYPFKLAAWRIKNHIVKDKGDTWTKVSNYHSRTLHYNEIYKRGVINYAIQWQTWLDKTNLKHVKLTFKDTVNNVQKISQQATQSQKTTSKNTNSKSKSLTDNFSSKIDLSVLQNKN